MRTRTAVIGAGSGGQAIAGHLGLSGYDVWLYDVDLGKIEALKKTGGISLKGVETGSATSVNFTPFLEEAVKKTEIIMVVTDATAHDEVARSLASFLEDGQIILLNPGYFLGALSFVQALREAEADKDIIVGDAESLIYACRSERPGEVYVYGIKRKLLIGTFPGKKVHSIINRMRRVYPQLRPARNILETAFGNVNPVLHVPIAVLNAGRIESGQEFRFYWNGGTPALMDLEEKLDQERLIIAEQLGIEARSIKRLLTDFYGVTGNGLYDIVRRNPSYANIGAPNSLQTRVITEDVPMGLVPMASAAESFGVAVPLHRALISLASALMNVDYWTKGRTMESLGLSRMGMEGVLEFLLEGYRE
jgi:opine dehydrogenase